MRTAGGVARWGPGSSAELSRAGRLHHVADANLWGREEELVTQASFMPDDRHVVAPRPAPVTSADNSASRWQNRPRYGAHLDAAAIAAQPRPNETADRRSCDGHVFWTS